MSWMKTDWVFVTSQGGEITGGEVINIGGGGGSIFLRNVRTRNRIELTYGGIGAGIGVGLPINIDISTQETESHGIGGVYGRDTAQLRPNDFTGACIIGNLQYAGICEGRSIVAFFFNVPIISGGGKALAFLWGRNVGFESGAGAMFYVGYVENLN